MLCADGGQLALHHRQQDVVHDGLRVVDRHLLEQPGVALLDGEELLDVVRGVDVGEGFDVAQN